MAHSTLVLISNDAFVSLERGAVQAARNLITAANDLTIEKYEDGCSRQQPFTIGTLKGAGVGIWNEEDQHVGVVVIAGGEARCVFHGYGPGMNPNYSVDQERILQQAVEKLGYQMVQHPVAPVAVLAETPVALVEVPELTFEEKLEQLQKEVLQQGLVMKIFDPNLQVTSVESNHDVELSEAERLERLEQEADALGYRLTKKTTHKNDGKNSVRRSNAGGRHRRDGADPESAV
jgi:hypothetical protein